jgi:hypothetical protein
VVTVEKDIEAVKFILACFFDEPHDEQKRDKLIKEKVLQNDMIKVYGMYSKEKLQDSLQVLQSQVSAGK